MRCSLCLLSVASVVLAACNTPAPPGQHLPHRTVTVEGSRFRVFHDSSSAVAIRTNPELNPRPAKIFPRAARAITQVTGCRIVPGTVDGDPAMIKAEILC